MIFLLRDFLESFIIISFGGCFILAEALLKTMKGDFKKAKILRVTRILFQLIASFFFTLAALLTGKHLHHFLHSNHGCNHVIITLLSTIYITIIISLFGKMIPLFFAESSPSWRPIHGIQKCSEYFIHWITPFVLFLDFIGSKILRLFGLSFNKNQGTSDEEVIQMMNEGLSTGVFNVSEREMVEGVLDLDEETASSLMTPRSHVVFLNLKDEDEKNWRRIISSGHSEFPVIQGNLDNIVGIVSIKALWANLSMLGSVKLADLITKPLYIFNGLTASKIIEEFRMKKHHTALVVDEFGVIEGLITLKDVIESILGVLPEREVKGYYPEIKKQKDGSWLVDAMLSFEEAHQKLGLPYEDDQDGSRYQTIGGFFLHQLGHIPKIGEIITIENFHLQVFSMNRNRIDKLRLMKVES
jgi:putative hemolysin